MSDGFEQARQSWRRLKALWREADFDTRFDVAVHWTGILMIAAAIIAQFGWSGALFCVGMTLRRISQ
ncbi:hypothetical protein [Bradyrhizobium sp.]|uniref:hypothetical protein n=1 Tax=Bradyrhizobium sp. TaxID=376 RepID=UPI002BEE3BC3|nr:hypothetical protein [Bradyrhizobium sp.]HWX60608.1 hypothetical protein [Bradyrhizobium sp.]